FRVSGFTNTGAGGRAGFALTLADCELRTAAGKTARVSGEIGCSGPGFDRIDVGEEPGRDVVGGDAGSGDVVLADAAGDDATERGDDATELGADTAGPGADTGPAVVAVDPCAGACGADEACVAGACVPRGSQTQPSCNTEPS